MKSPNVPLLSVTLLIVLLLILFSSGRYESILPKLTTATEEQYLPYPDGSNLSPLNASLLVKPTERKTCIVYERPPRTGSTTIGEAVRKCLLPQGYKQPAWKGFDARASVISDMLQLPFERVMTVTHHFYMNATTLRQLQSGCETLFYFTSTATMKQRLWSLVKYRQLHKHGNASLSKEQVQSAIADLKKEKQQIKVLNAYPYLYNLSKAVNMGQIERIVPDYVIRKSRLVDDSSALLRAFGCSAQVISQNVHRARYDDVLDNIDIDDDDALYSRLLHYAEDRNELGLKKAFDFGR